VTEHRELLHRTLGVAPGASLSSLKRAYRHAAKRCHPDVCADADAIERFLEVQNAYEELLAESGSLRTAGQLEMINKWRAQVQKQAERAEEREDAQRGACAAVVASCHGR
jgi:uncharacterized protein